VRVVESVSIAHTWRTQIIIYDKHTWRMATHREAVPREHQTIQRAQTVVAVLF
jgi:hypothetical protein